MMPPHPEHIFERAERLYHRLLRHRWLNVIVKSIVLGLLLGFMWYELGHRNKLSEMWAEFLRHLKGANWFLLLLVLALMPLNWLAETEKWHQFVRRYEPMSRTRAVMAVLAGVSFSLFTPNRIGEYGGRLLFVRAEWHWNALIANLVGNFSQFMVLLAGGVLGAIYTLQHFSLVEPWVGHLFIAAAIVGLAIMMWVYFHLEGVIDMVRKLPFANHFQWVFRRFNLGILRHFNRRELSDILRWASIRYSIYVAQYFLLIRFFGIQVDLIGGIAGIAGLFLLQTSIPLPPMTGLVARGNLAVVLWQQFGANELSALAATFSLWVINLVLPALFGTFSILHVNISKTLGYDGEDSNVETTPLPLAPADNIQQPGTKQH